MLKAFATIGGMNIGPVCAEKRGLVTTKNQTSLFSRPARRKAKKIEQDDLFKDLI